MKRKSTRVEKTLQQAHGKIRWKNLRKRLLVVGLTVAIVSNTIDFSVLSVSAKTETKEATIEATIVSFEKLSKDITEQTLPIGAPESDINFPDSLTVTVEKTVQVENDKEDSQDVETDTSETETDTAETEINSEEQNETQKDEESSEEGTTASNDKDNAENPKDEESSETVQNSEASDNENESDKSDSSDVESQSIPSDDSGNIDSYDTEDTQTSASLPSVFGAFLGQMADTHLPHTLVVHAAEKDDAATSAVSETDSSAQSVKTTGSSDEASETETRTETRTEKIRLKNIKWELNVEESDAEEFDSSEASNGFCYAYTPVLPDEDGDGNQLVLGKDVELPTIYVLVGEYGIALLSDTFAVTETTEDGTTTTKSVADIITYLKNTIKGRNLKKVEIKLLSNYSTTEFKSNITITNSDTEEMKLDLDGHTLSLLTNDKKNSTDGGLFFQNNSTTITSSRDGGKFVGYRNNVEGCGLITVNNGSELNIKDVTIENQGTAPTVIVGYTDLSTETATCTITNSTIIGRRKAGVVRAQNGGDAVCTIDKGTTVRNQYCSVYGKPGANCIAISKTEGSEKIPQFIIEDGAILEEEGSTNEYVINIEKEDYINVIIKGGTFRGKLQTAKKDAVKISGGTFGDGVTNGAAVAVTYTGGTLQDIMEEGYCLKTSDGTDINLTGMDSGSKYPVTVGHLPLYFATQPSIDEDMATVAEGYAKAPELTVKALAGGEISYQWYVNKTVDGNAETEVKLTTNATSPIYQIPTGLPVGTYEYYCVATTDSESATSEKVTFTVEKAAVETTINEETETYLSLEKALTAISESSEGAATLKILKDIDSETFSSKEIKGDVTIDLNGHAVGYKDNSSDWQTGIDKFGFCITGGTVTLTDSSENKAGCLHGTLQVEGGEFSLESGACENLKVSTGTAGVSGGTCETVEVNSGAVLTVTGDSAKITTLKAVHKRDARAEVTLSGGHFGSIAVEISDLPDPEGALSDEEFQLAIEDMLAPGYAFYNSAGELCEDIERDVQSVTNVSVRSLNVDAGNAVVRIDVTKKDGTAASTYHASWKQAIDYLSDESPVKSEFKNWQSVKIVLLKDAKINKNVKAWGFGGSDELPRAITVCSENGTHTLTGGGYTTVLNSMLHNITLQNIKITGAYIKIDGDLTLGAGVEVSGTPHSSKATIELYNGELKLDNAKVTASTNGSYAVDLYNATLRMSDSTGKALTYVSSVYISGKTVTAVIDANSAGSGGVNLPAFSGDSDSKLKIFYTGRNAKFDTALKNYKGESEVWYTISLYDGATLDEDKNTDTVTSFDDKLFGLYNKNKASDPKNVIYVSDNACRYDDINGTYNISSGNKFFYMPASNISIYAHKLGEDGKCPGCGKIDIEKAYENNALTIEGLEGRTYDSYPQILSKITWQPVSGDEQELIKPSYDAKQNRGTLGFGGDKPLNSNADYTVVYKNNVGPYSLKPDDAGFDKEVAPQVTITGTGWNYIGSLTIYFTIGKGEMRLGNFDVCGANGDITYDGQGHKAWDTYAVEFKVDEGDKGQFSQLGDGEYIPTCNTSEAEVWYGQDWSDPNQVEYSTDEQNTWIVEKEFGSTAEKMYMITDAGEYPFYIKVTNKSCGVLISDKLTAEIKPRDLSKVTFDNSEDVIAYYTGKPIIPTAWDDKLVDKGLKDETGTAAAPEYTLKRDTDFTITAEDNTDISTVGGVGTAGEKLAKATITGTGNYKGELSVKFQIKSAFTLKQTTLSTEKWYREDPYYWKGDGVPVGFSETDVSSSSSPLPSRSMKYIVCRADKEEAAGLSKDVDLYTSLEDAIADRNPGYTFKGEGSQTVKLWGKDPKTGYISEPVDVTLKIDTTAPTWADENGNTEGFGIQIKENWWRKLLNTVSFGFLYNNHTLEVKIKANDEKLGVNGVSGLDQNGARYYCYIQKIDDTAAGGEVAVKTKAELDDMRHGGNDITTSFIFVSSGLNNVGTVSNALKNDGNYIIYAYAVDNAGNKSDYICTEGIVVDAQAPTVTISTEDSRIRDTEAAISVELDEDATLLYFYVDESRKNLTNAEGTGYDNLTQEISNYVKPNSEPADRPTVGPLAQKKENGKWEPSFTESGDQVTIAKISGVAVTVPAYKIEAKKGTTEIQITGLQPSEKFQIWMAAIDKAGNFSGYSVTPFTTTKAMPRVTTLPEVSGVYGDTFAELKVKDGVAQYDGAVIEGTWEVTSTGNTPLQVGDTTPCEVTFTPDATKYNDTYEATVVEVTPAIAPRPITIKVANMHKDYGEPCPGIDDLDFAIDESTPLVVGDTKDTIKQDLVIEIPESAAKPDSNYGNYRISFKLKNKNYNVTAWKCYADLTDSDTVEYCQLVIAKAAGKIKKLSEFNATQNVQYQYEGEFATFNLGAEAGHKEAALQYAITDAKKANGDTITDAAEIANKLLSISVDGKVTIKGAGSAKITISLPESTNYTAATPLTVEVNIAQAYSNPPNIYRDFLFLRGGSDSIDLAALLPKDCGEVTYGAVKTSDSKGILEGAPTISQDGKLSYEVKAGGAAGDEATITVPVSTANYNINTNQGILIVIRLIDQLPIQPNGSISLKTDTLTYGEALSSLQFNSVTFTDKVTGKTVPGRLSFDEPDKKPDAGYYTAAWTFTPMDDAYAKYMGTIAVTVKKAVPKVVSVPVPEAYPYNPAGILADWCQSHAQKPGEVRGADGAMLDGIWSFKDTSLVPKPGTNACPVIFTPTDTKNYETIEKTVTLTVKKAVPYISTQPTAAKAYTHGDYLYNQAPTGVASYGNGMGSAGTGTGADTPIAGTFKWKAPSTKLTYLGNKTFDYIFTPEDTDSYETVTGSVTVTVEKAAKAPFMPGSEMNVAHSCETVGSVKLPQGWKWEDADAAVTLADDMAVSATAVYDGADKGSYVTESVTIQITRSSCEHAKTEAKGAVKATCIAEGTTGETWCLVCSKKISDGVTTPKDTANHTALVSKQLRPATTTQEGIMSYACSDCGYYEEKPIAKIATGGGSSGSDSNSGSNSSSGSPSLVIKPEPKPTPAPTPAQVPAIEPVPTPTPAPTPAPSVQPFDNIRKPQSNTSATEDQTAEGEQAKPFIRGEDGKEGWDVIRAEVEVCADGNTIVVDMNGSSVVPGDIFDAIRGKDITIEFDLGNGISWHVNGNSVQKDEVGDIDFRVTLGEEAGDAIPVDIVNALTGERYSLNLTLAYEGTFGFDAVLRANVGAENKGLIANLFYYNHSTGELEFISAGEIDESGYTELIFTHASDYTIVLDTVSMEEQVTAPDVSDTDMNADKADTIPAKEDADATDASGMNSRTALIWLIIFAGIAAAAVGFVIVKTRRKEK